MTTEFAPKDRQSPSSPAAVSQATAWMIAVVAMVPMFAIYAAHFLGAPAGTSPTGFLQYDQPAYAGDAYAAAAAGPPFVYGLPFSPYPDTPKVYFQPLSAVLGLFLLGTGFNPGYVYAALGALLGVVMYRTGIAVAVAYVGDRLGRATWPVLLAFLWGGGALVIAGVAKFWIAQHGVGDFAAAAFSVDPFSGWWCLNLGRNVYFTVEAFYHIVFLGAIWLVLMRRYGWALAAIAFESASHPFTGLELVLVVGAFAALERVVLRRPDPPLWFLAGVAAVLVAHLGYYMALLPALSPEHRLLVLEWLHPWTLSVPSMTFAYGPVAALAGWAVFMTYRTESDDGRRRMRLALAWFVAAFSLANHELVVAPRQPLHFTRGYVWTPLMLLALPLLAEWFNFALTLPRRALGLLAVVGPLLVICLDNAAWFGWHLSLMAQGQAAGSIWVSDDTIEVLKRLAAADMADRLILSDEDRRSDDEDQLSYLAVIYDQSRAWLTTGDNTPRRRQREQELADLFTTGAEVAEWRQRPVVVVFGGGDPRVVARLRGDFSQVETIGHYTLLTR